MKLAESKVRTNKLYCSACRRKINIGETVVFVLDIDDKMKDVYCSKCNAELLEELAHERALGDAIGHGQS